MDAKNLFIMCSCALELLQFFICFSFFARAIKEFLCCTLRVVCAMCLCMQSVSVVANKIIKSAAILIGSHTHTHTNTHSRTHTHACRTHVLTMSGSDSFVNGVNCKHTCQTKQKWTNFKNLNENKVEERAKVHTAHISATASCKLVAAVILTYGVLVRVSASVSVWLWNYFIIALTLISFGGYFQSHMCKIFRRQGEDTTKTTPTTTTTTTVTPNQNHRARSQQLSISFSALMQSNLFME